MKSQKRKKNFLSTENFFENARQKIYGQRQSCWRLLLKMTDRENLFATNLEKYHSWRYVNLFIVGPELTEIMSFFKSKNLGNFRFAELMKLLSESEMEPVRFFCDRYRYRSNQSDRTGPAGIPVSLILRFFDTLQIDQLLH
jgi:hypothetical protein